MTAIPKIPKNVKKTYDELIDEKIITPWTDCGRENFVLNLEGQVVCLEYTKNPSILPDRKIIFKLEPTVFYNGEYPVYRN